MQVISPGSGGGLSTYRNLAGNSLSYVIHIIHIQVDCFDELFGSFVQIEVALRADPETILKTINNYIRSNNNV